MKDVENGGEKPVQSRGRLLTYTRSESGASRSSCWLFWVLPLLPPPAARPEGVQPTRRVMDTRMVPRFPGDHRHEVDCLGLDLDV